jgi:hypothetical protein
MFHEDHAPPHFHVEYAECRAVVEIESGRLLAGKLPNRCLSLVEEWRKLHLAEIRRAWETTQKSKPPKRIKPLR